VRVTFGNNQSIVEVDRPSIRRLVGKLARQENAPAGEVSLVFVDDSYIRELHGRYAGVRRATDVLAFPLGGRSVPGCEDDGTATGGRGSARRARRDPKLVPGAARDELIGEVYVSAERALAQARRYRVGLGQEVARLIIHGVLHLLGYRDDIPSSRKVMIRRQEAFLREHGPLASAAARRAPRRGA
jgi:probable rRNA maturation factor